MELNPELGLQERLLWAGRPIQRLILLRPADAFLIPFGRVWLGIVIAGAFGAARNPQQENSVPAVVAFIFVFIGLYFVIGRFLVDALQRRRTFYGVTGQRVIIVHGLMNSEVKSINLKSMSDLSLTERRGGTGTIRFGSSSGFGWSGAGLDFWWPGSTEASSFVWIPDARQVYEQIRAAQTGSA